jgi:hypothetical protein
MRFAWDLWRFAHDAFCSPLVLGPFFNALQKVRVRNVWQSYLSWSRICARLIAQKVSTEWGSCEDLAG